MQAIRCELCGSSDIMKQEGFYICQNCKTKYSVEEAMKLIGVVKIDKSEDIENLLILARRNFDSLKYDESDKYYELALREAPNNWEAVFYHAWLSVNKTYREHPLEDLKALLDGTSLALEFVPQQLDAEQQHQALSTIVHLHSTLVCEVISATKLFGIATPTYLGAFELIRRTSSLYEFMEGLIKTHFADDHELLKTVQQANYNNLQQNPKIFPRRERRERMKRLKTEIKK